jgi:uroporphyrin-III C-methyltransferase/precorrin-2 dehydrogenase/sirohydrochlorin ferrochelatase/uroporphyrin-III C-methyltransferase
MKQTAAQKGRVIIAGAGPGDPELITRKAARYLQSADVVLTDRLVSDELLRELVKPGANVIYVGKQCRSGQSTPQETINELMLEFASQGKLVVRLKGGDVSIFSNILDELETLVANNISYEIIPGVSAALGAAASAGIPLTARGYSTAVRFLTYYKSDVLSDEYWQELANTSDTLVFYMSSETLSEAVTKLIQFNISSDCEIAVIEQATTPLQNIYTSNIYNFSKNLQEQRFVSPSLVIIGRVVSLNKHFSWIINSNSKENYFKPVASIADKTDQNNNTKRYVARA